MPGFLSGNNLFFVSLAILAIVTLRRMITIVPQNMAYVIERLGKYYATINTGRYLLFPFVNNIAYRYSLEEQAVTIPAHPAISGDNISLLVDSALYLKVVDPYKASYIVGDYVYAVTQLAQTIMRSEIGKIEFDKNFETSEDLNTNIVPAINEAAVHWGVQVVRYEVNNIVKEE